MKPVFLLDFENQILFHSFKKENQNEKSDESK